MQMLVVSRAVGGFVNWCYVPESIVNLHFKLQRPDTKLLNPILFIDNTKKKHVVADFINCLRNKKAFCFKRNSHQPFSCLIVSKGNK